MAIEAATLILVHYGAVESLREWLEARGCANLGRNASGSPISVLRGWVGGFPGARGGQQPACIPTGDAAAGLAFKVREGVSPLLVYAANSADSAPDARFGKEAGSKRGQRGGSTPGQCKMGAACFFYHGEDDVSTPERPIPVPKWLADQAKQEGIDVIEDGDRLPTLRLVN
ncbi:hypothetical protein EMIHUDRAFT_219257 [Emiliania huxleyi CCMP1516]|uniref:C3H1-type domain-containing protein n=2 Tax=Emiliania huxleyi TaxID=2903 RepID=A0A0D3I545_EMIH1|nr:hypothetical protein EMIHUDRAFT_219257 [Emiliania huxleyi CCMP1516]EOD06380.1 hypothetical protein EMIHUDRAFT_219257 [Emiliania huxleyi CCMP1516]|eukprot:XP_005758809.1 hypothetical protein EMIHUDRAFT_219257 [Emiliania huxleyi CCMP1516]